MKSIEQKLSKYKNFWTKDIGSLAVIDFGDKKPSMIFDLSIGAPMLIEEELEVLEALVEKMRQSGSKIISSEDIKKNSWR